MHKLFTKIFMFALALMVLGVVGFASLPAPEAGAALTDGRYETLSGWSLSTANGNATGAVTGTKLFKGDEFPESWSCLGYVANASGAVMVNTATFNIEGSMDNSKYAILQTVSLTASTVTAFRNVTAPAARYYRVNVGAIQNANSTYVTVDCLFD
jgi:hypothetical protein